MRQLEKTRGVWHGGVRVIVAVSLCLGMAVRTSESWAAGEKNTPEALRIDVVGQTLSAEIGDAGLGEVLREVGRQAGFGVEIYGDLGQVRPQKFQGVPLEEGIRRLVGDNRVNLMMRYEVDEAGERQLVEVTARAAGEVPAELLEQRRMRAELARIRVPPPPPPPPPMQ